jgi:hypothetical protein
MAQYQDFEETTISYSDGSSETRMEWDTVDYTMNGGVNEHKIKNLFRRSIISSRTVLS